MSRELSVLEWEILNSTADDAENLEQIYRDVCFEFVDDPDGVATGAWRMRDGVVSLGKVADAVRALVESRLLNVRQDPADSLPANDASYVWRGWFEPTAEGRTLWSKFAAESSHHAEL